MRQYAVIGLGRFGMSVAKALAESGCNVLGIDRDKDLVNEAANFLSDAVILDATDERALRTVGISSMDAVIIAIGDDIAASILSTLIVKEQGVPLVVAKALIHSHGKILKRIGADQIVFPENEIGKRVAERLVHPNVLEQFNVSEDYTILEVVVPPSLVGKTVKDCGLRQNFGINVLAVMKSAPVIGDSIEVHSGRITLIPSPDDLIEQEDTLLIMGHTNDLDRFKSKYIKIP